MIQLATWVDGRYVKGVSKQFVTLLRGLLTFPPLADVARRKDPASRRLC